MGQVAASPVFLIFFVILAILKGASGSNYLGCYKDFIFGKRLFTELEKDFRTTLTPEICVEFCKEKGFSYAGLQYSYECFCSKQRLSFIYLADESDCSYKCDGDTSKLCGGHNRMSIYGIEEKSVNFVQPNYVGCYADPQGGRALTDKRGPDSDSMTPELCVGFCFRNGYRFAAVQYRKECFCGDEILGPQKNEDECSMKCSGDSKFFCGGELRNNIYNTSIKEESEDGKLLGCFEDGPGRLLSEFRIDLRDTNNPKKCMNICKHLGFQFSGVEFGIECYCGNIKPEKNKERNKNECFNPCPDASKRCGGALRILVHTTSEDVSTLSTVSTVSNYLGCYKEFIFGTRIFGEREKDFRTTLTPEICVEFCKEKGFSYAGLQYSYECFCSKQRLSFIYLADESDCSYKCDGDTSKLCGGHNRMSIYGIEEKSVNFVQPNYVGCYADPQGGRALTGKRGPDSDSMTPELCVGFCFRNGYRFAAVQYRKECFCGDEIYGHSKNEGECSMDCTGNSHFFCGGTFRNNVYRTAIPDESEDGNLLGCFEDGADRLLSEFRIDLHETNNPKKCMNICKQLGFRFSGVEFGVECYCGNTKPEKNKERNENECLAKCPDDTKRCGGALRILVHTTSEDVSILNTGSKYIGCYKDFLFGSRLFTGLKEDFKKTLTPEICITFCKGKGFSYAGLQFSYECFCSNERHSFIYSADESDCNNKCTGDNLKFCGGFNRYSVFDIVKKHVNFVQPNYIGCYADTETRKALADKRGPDSSSMTPELCVGYCFRNGYRFAAVQFRKQCYCGDEIVGQRKNEDECSMECTGDSKFFCGGEFRSNIYHTSIPGESEEGKLLGCFEDAADRLLTDFHINLPETNNPKKCMNICKQLGFQYAGVEYGIECFCGNRKPDKKKERSENQCFTKCPDGSKRCGGKFRILVYTTSGGDFIIKSGTNILKTCVKSLTEVAGKKVCQGDRIFHETFDGSSLSDKWTHAVLMPSEPDFEFVLFENYVENINVSNGKLFIKPTLFDDEFVRRGSIELDGCTGDLHTEDCKREARAYYIIPPVKSARINTKNSFSFKYGKIQVRAKLPLGDWIVPELWLEPVRKVYGLSYKSGKIRLALARGNEDLVSFTGIKLGNTLLESGVVMGLDKKTLSQSVRKENDEGWHQQFHNYTLVWTPDNLSFTVDDDEKIDLFPEQGEKISEILGFDGNEQHIWSRGTLLAPFDQEFHISFGLSVGGMKYFPDDCVSGGSSKPWRNNAVKAMLYFWEHRQDWFPTWNDKSQLQIEEVNVFAL